MNNYGSVEISGITADEILKQAGLDDMDIEIFQLRHGLEWYHQDIGVFVGNKYRGKIYTEGAIRYRLRVIRGILNEFLTTFDQD